MISACPVADGGPCQGPEPGSQAEPLSHQAPVTQATLSVPALSPGQVPGCSHLCKSAPAPAKMPFGAGKVGVGILQTGVGLGVFIAAGFRRREENSPSSAVEQPSLSTALQPSPKKKKLPLTHPPEPSSSSKGGNISFNTCSPAQVWGNRSQLAILDLHRNPFFLLG